MKKVLAMIKLDEHDRLEYVTVSLLPLLQVACSPAWNV
jgi:hypothetical protein